MSMICPLLSLSWGKMWSLLRTQRDPQIFPLLWSPRNTHTLLCYQGGNKLASGQNEDNVHISTFVFSGLFLLIGNTTLLFSMTKFFEQQHNKKITNYSNKLMANSLSIDCLPNNIFSNWIIMFILNKEKLYVYVKNMNL